MKNLIEGNSAIELEEIRARLFNYIQEEIKEAKIAPYECKGFLYSKVSLYYKLYSRFMECCIEKNTREDGWLNPELSGRELMDTLINRCRDIGETN